MVGVRRQLTETPRSPDCPRRSGRRGFYRDSDFTLMSHSRRAFAALSGLLLLQLMLLGSGTLCAMQRDASHRGMSDGGMQVSGMQATTHSHKVVVASGHDAGGPAGGAQDRDSCRVPLAPGQCASMSACAISAAPSRMVGASLAVRIVALSLPTVTRIPSGPTFAPELPPPRA